MYNVYIAKLYSTKLDKIGAFANVVVENTGPIRTTPESNMSQLHVRMLNTDQTISMP